MYASQFSQAYQSRMQQLFSDAIPPGLKVLELGCGEGHLLAGLRPSEGVGIDRDMGAINLARENYPDLDFHVQHVEDLNLDGTFDVIIMADLLVSVEDILELFQRLQPLSHGDTRWFIASQNALWQGVINLAERLGLKQVGHNTNWLSHSDIKNLLHLADMDLVNFGSHLLLPIPGLEPIGRMLEPLTGMFNWIMFFEARPAEPPELEEWPVTVVVPTRNEAGNIRDAVERIPDMGSWTEILFVDGNSTDGTQAEIQKMIEEFPERKIRLIHQVELDEPEDEAMAKAQRTGKMLPQGKADAVRKAFRAAEGEVLMICDADLTVAPEDLPKFYRALAANKGGFINGCRLLYPMEDGAMKYINLMGNKFFSICFTWLLGHYVKDTLCGTKVFRKSHYDEIMSFTDKVGDFDPFGDFELLFGAAAAGLKIIDLPIRYRRRLYGQPKIENFKHSILLFQMIGRGILSLPHLRSPSRQLSS